MSMNKIVVTVVANSVAVSSPYHPDFAPKARKLGGRWQPTTKTWSFDVRDEGRVRALLRAVFGDDGSAPVETLTVRCGSGPLEGRQGTFGGSRPMSWWLAGREVARAYGRDSGAKLGDGVIVLKGSFSSGGSVKNPGCYFSEDLQVEVRDVPKDKAVEIHAASHGVTLLDEAGNVVLAETYESPAVEAAARLGGDEAAEAYRGSSEGQLDDVEREIAAAEGLLAGLRFRAAELRAA